MMQRLKYMEINQPKSVQLKMSRHKLTGVNWQGGGALKAQKA